MGRARNRIRNTIHKTRQVFSRKNPDLHISEPRVSLGKTFTCPRCGGRGCSWCDQGVIWLDDGGVAS